MEVQESPTRVRNDVQQQIIEQDDGHAAMHYLQQSAAAAEFLHGGGYHNTVVAEHVLTPEQAADMVRENLRLAMDALERASQ